VVVAGEVVGELDAPGLVVLLGVRKGDRDEEAAVMADKLWNLRIMPDADGRMNLSAADLGAGLLVVSQFTLYGDTSKGRRPSFESSASGEVAEPLFAHVIACLRALGARVAAGRFGAEMLLELANDGPVTLILDVSR